MQERLHIRDVSKYYNNGDATALQNVNLSIERGKIVALVGNSGSGKTTLLRLISGFEQPNNGDILLDNTLLCNNNFSMAAEERRIGYVFQEYALFPHMTVKQNIEFGISERNKSFRKSRIELLADITEITKILLRYPHEISGGEKQRVALARALAPEPSILLMDEPFNGLDTALKLRILPSILRIIRKTGLSALIVTHDRDEAFMIADKIALIRGGKLIQYSAPQRLYEAPSCNYAARFFGEANLFPLSIDDEGVHTVLGTLPHSAIRNIQKSEKKHRKQLQILIRPQNIVLCQQDDALQDNCSPALSAKVIVRDQIYCGDYILAHLLLDIPGSSEQMNLTAHLPPTSSYVTSEQYILRVQQRYFYCI